MQNKGEHCLMSQDYNKTLNLPKTDFPMRANLPKREQELFEKLNSGGIYEKILKKNEGKPPYILHDGPPYANGEIHLGTALNKVLKDFIIKQKNMSGFKAPYVPGWDTHGLPIELKALKSSGIHRETVTPVELREICKDFAITFVDNQRKQFKKLGVIGDYANPYLTLKPEYEATQIRIFGEMAKKDIIYKGLKPVYWCPTCNTALAEAEIEYAQDSCYSIYVKFPVVDDKGFFQKLGIDKSVVSFVIWTTTTWTLPGNVAVCLGPSYQYTLVKVSDEYLIMAEELVAATMEAAGIDDYQTVGSFKGEELEYMTVKHPFLERNSLVILGDHVTLESGTGCVHTAPGHGVEDFEACQKYKNIPMVVPVDDKGILTEEAGQFAGLSIDKANKEIAAFLEQTNALLAIKKIEHQYPHCWRCQSPILFRATQQWFCSIDGFKKQAINAIDKVNWIPSWGEGRIKGMVADRSDWCISRQRLWGVPIPIIYCEDCGEPIINDVTIEAIAHLFEKLGSNGWYTEDLDSFIPESVICPKCGCRHFRKETDIMDVWFDSGVSHAAVLAKNPDLSWPADLYLEGSDQYRGWFQSSLLTAVAWKGEAPYKNVCTHGWVVDGDGRKMSKSMENGIAPEKIIQQYGTDILRLWVASSDYHADIRISKEILKQLSEIYRKIRNTSRFILGNLYDFDIQKNQIPLQQLPELDRWALWKLNKLIQRVMESYDHFEFYTIFHAVHNFCVLDMSNFYLDIIKDRLYCEKADGFERKSAQTAMHIILTALTKLIAPILAFTSEEIWSYLPGNDSKGSVLLEEMPELTVVDFDQSLVDKWQRIYDIREAAKKALEIKRTEKVIGSSLEAGVILYCEEKDIDFFNENRELLRTVCIVSDLTIQPDKQGAFVFEQLGLSMDIFKAQGEKCERCWTYSTTVGRNSSHPTLCERCCAVLSD